MVLSEAAKARRGAEIGYWVFVIVWLIAWLVFAFWLFTTSNFIHTYQLPSNTPGTLTSTYWSWDFVRVGLLTLWILVPFSGLFMIWTRSSDGVGVHMVLGIVLLIWFLIMMAFDINDITKANLPPSDPNWKSDNQATDIRWCCIYGGQPGTERVCANQVPCVPPVGVSQLGVNGDYVFRFAFNLIFIAFLIFDIVFTGCVWIPRQRKWLQSIGMAPTESGNGDANQLPTTAANVQNGRRRRYQRK